MHLPTSAWTDRHAAVACLLGAAMVGSLSGLTEESPLPLWVAATIGLAVVPALALDLWGGALVGLGSAAALVALRRATDHWSSDMFGPALLETLAIVVVGALAGHVGTRLRPSGHSPTAGLLQPVHGSLGLLDEDAAMARLEEEVGRSRRHGRTLSLALLDVRILDDGLPEEGRRAALRSVARILESRSAQDHVPFALAEDRLGVVLPDASASGAWDLVARVLEAVGTSQVTYGSERTSRRLDDTVELYVGVSQHGPRADSPEAMLAVARRALERARQEDEELTS